MSGKGLMYLRLLGAVLLILVVMATFTHGAEISDEMNGVISEERIVNLPQDQNRWYLSVVGDSGNKEFRTVTRWFTSNAKLVSFRKQTHYRNVTSDTEIFKSRYKGNVDSLPTVRLQDASGVVIYESSGNSIPYSPQALYASLARAVNKAVKGPCRPWRKKKCPTPKPKPSPEPSPSPLDELPNFNDGPPIIDTTPDEKESKAGLIVLAVIAGLLAGSVAGTSASLADSR